VKEGKGQATNADGWLSGKKDISANRKPCCTNSQRFLFWNRWKRRTQEGTGLLRFTCVLYDTEAMKPGLKPRVPRPPETVDRRMSLTPNSSMEGHCLYDLEEPFSITLASLSNVNVVNFSSVITTLLLSVGLFTGLVFQLFEK